MAIKWAKKKSYNICQKFEVSITRNKGNTFHGSDIGFRFKPGLTSKISNTGYVCIGREANRIYFGGGNVTNGWKIGKYKSCDLLKITEHSAGLGTLKEGNYDLEYDADNVLYFIDLNRDVTNSIVWGKKGR